MRLLLKIVFSILFFFTLYAELFDATFFFFSRNSMAHYRLGEDVVYLLKTLIILGSLLYSLKRVILQKEIQGSTESQEIPLIRRLIYGIIIFALSLTFFSEGKDLLIILRSGISIEEMIINLVVSLFVGFCIILSIIFLMKKAI